MVAIEVKIHLLTIMMLIKIRENSLSVMHYGACKECSNAAVTFATSSFASHFNKLMKIIEKFQHFFIVIRSYQFVIF